MNQPVQQSSDQMRADFEAWARSVADNKFPDLSREGDGYWQARTNTSWETWKAAIAATQVVADQPRDERAECDKFISGYRVGKPYWSSAREEIMRDTWMARALLASNAGKASSDLSENAQWLTTAHMICTEQGVPQGHIQWRLDVLRGLLDESASSEPAVAAIEAVKLPDAPKHIYLVIEDGNGLYPFPTFQAARESASDSEGLMWCPDRQGISDIKYIRADLASTPAITPEK